MKLKFVNENVRTVSVHVYVKPNWKCAQCHEFQLERHKKKIKASKTVNGKYSKLYPSKVFKLNFSLTSLSDPRCVLRPTCCQRQSQRSSGCDGSVWLCWYANLIWFPCIISGLLKYSFHFICWAGELRESKIFSKDIFNQKRVPIQICLNFDGSFFGQLLSIQYSVVFTFAMPHADGNHMHTVFLSAILLQVLLLVRLGLVLIYPLWAHYGFVRVWSAAVGLYIPCHLPLLNSNRKAKEGSSNSIKFICIFSTESIVQNKSVIHI
jgi:hypothetical protein